MLAVWSILLVTWPTKSSGWLVGRIRIVIGITLNSRSWFCCWIPGFVRVDPFFTRYGKPFDRRDPLATTLAYVDFYNVDVYACLVWVGAQRGHIIISPELESNSWVGFDFLVGIGFFLAPIVWVYIGGSLKEEKKLQGRRPNSVGRGWGEWQQ